MKKIVGFLLVYILAIGSTAVAQKKVRIEPPDVYVRTARIAILSKEYRRAERNLAICLENYPEYYQAHYLMGAIWAGISIKGIMSLFVLSEELVIRFFSQTQNHRHDA